MRKGGMEPVKTRARANSIIVWRLGEDARDVAHLAARPDFELAVKMESEVGLASTPRMSRQSSASSPTRLCNFDPATTRRPTWRPASAMARICCSNCDVCAPSGVQWPEL